MPTPPKHRASSALRILVVDDHDMFGRALASLLESDAAVGEVHTSSDTEEALAVAQSWHPDLVLMDVGMPGIGGISAAAQLRSLPNPPRVIMLSGYDDEELVVDALRAGAKGYILKAGEFEELSFAISAVMRGCLYLAGELTLEHDLEEYVQRAHSNHRSSRLDSLTQREREVMRMIAEGYTSRQIADLLHVSTRTVEGHRERLMTKLGVHNKVELTRFAIRHGALVPDTPGDEARRTA